MKTAIKAALAAMMMIAVVSVTAQPKPEGRPSPEESAKMMTERLKKELSLTDQQAEQIFKFNLQAMQSKMPKDSVERKKMFDARTAEMKKILTPEQFKKWEQMQKAMMDRMRGMRGPGPQMTPEQMVDAKANNWKKALGLSDQQVSQLKKLFADNMKLQREKGREAWKEIAAAEEAQLKTILTPEQYQKHLQIKKAESERDGRRDGNKEDGKDKGDRKHGQKKAGE